jgi:hypothetical protein
VNAAVDGAVATLNIFNPLAYLNSVNNEAHDTSGVETVIGGYWTLPVEERALAVWLLAALLGSLAVAAWTRREA